MDELKLKELDDWAREFYSRNDTGKRKGCYDLVRIAFGSIPGVDFEIDLEIKKLGEFLSLLPKKDAEDIYNTYTHERKKYMDKVCKDYDVAALKMNGALTRLLNNGMRAAYIQDKRGSLDDFQAAVRCLRQMIRDNDPRKKCKYNSLSEFHKTAESSSSLSPEIAELFLHVSSYPRGLFPMINEVIGLDREYLEAERMYIAFHEMKMSTFQESVLPETSKKLNEKGKEILDKQKKLLEQRNKKLGELNAEIERNKEMDAARQLESDTRRENEKISGDYIDRQSLKSSDSRVIDITSREEKQKPQSPKVDIIEQMKRDEAWKDARERFDNASIFRRMRITLQGKHPKALNQYGTSELSIEEVERLYR